MARILLTELLVFASPFIVFLIWRAFAPGEPEDQPPMPVLNLTAIGAGLALIAFIGLVLIAGPRDDREDDPFVPPPLRDQTQPEPETDTPS
jgi:hypothetical protein